MAAPTQTAASADAAMPPDPYDFSLVLGGPLFQLLRRAHLAGDGLELLRRRIVAGVVITWAPLLVLSAWEGMAWGGAVRMPFLYDAEVQARFLIALPLLVLAELIVHSGCGRWSASSWSGISSPSTAARSSTPRSSPRNGCATRWPRRSC
jgi:hypothetical protein